MRQDSKSIERAVRPLVAAIATLLVVAVSVATARTTFTPPTLGFITGGRVAVMGGGQSAGVAASTAVQAPVAVLPRSLDGALRAAGMALPPGANVYAAKIGRGANGATYEEYVAGGGALATDFWPASSIKVLAAVGALSYVGSLGYTGAAMVAFGDTGESFTIRTIYDAAIRESSNADYDRLVEIAGVDWLNNDFLTLARGFPATVIQRSYAGNGPLDSPALTLSEGGRRTVVAARSASTFTECPQGNCSNLFEMSESVRRVVLHSEIPAGERFAIAAPDAAALADALLGAEGFVEPAVVKVLGAGAKVYKKPGAVGDRDCLDVSLIETRSGQRFLLSVTVPAGQGSCSTLVAVATAVLRVLSG